MRACMRRNSSRHVKTQMLLPLRHRPMYAPPCLAHNNTMRMVLRPYVLHLGRTQMCAPTPLTQARAKQISREHPRVLQVLLQGHYTLLQGASKAETAGRNILLWGRCSTGNAEQSCGGKACMQGEDAMGARQGLGAWGPNGVTMVLQGHTKGSLTGKTSVSIQFCSLPTGHVPHSCSLGSTTLFSCSTGNIPHAHLGSSKLLSAS